MMIVYCKIYIAAQRVVEAEARATTGLHVNKAVTSAINNTDAISLANNTNRDQVNQVAHTGNKNTHKSSSVSAITSLSISNYLRGSSGAVVMNNNTANTGNSAAVSISANATDQSQETPTSTPISSSRTSSVMRERKASITLGVIMTAFTVCWLPFFSIAILRPFFKVVDRIPRPYVLLTLWLGYSNSFLNPIIYVTFHHDFRNAFKHLLCFRWSTINEHIRKEEYKSQYGETHYHENIRKMRNQQQQQQQQQLLSKTINQLA